MYFAFPHCAAVACQPVGLVASYYGRPMFPEFCRVDETDSCRTRFDTMIRVGGSYTSVSLALLAVFRAYGWKQVVLISDTENGAPCMSFSADVYERLSTTTEWNVTIHWIHMRTDATTVDIVDCLTRARSFSRGNTIQRGRQPIKFNEA